jgi:hypothetical protein
LDAEYKYKLGDQLLLYCNNVGEMMMAKNVAGEVKRHRIEFWMHFENKQHVLMDQVRVKKSRLAPKFLSEVIRRMWAPITSRVQVSEQSSCISVAEFEAHLELRHFNSLSWR